MKGRSRLRAALGGVAVAGIALAGCGGTIAVQPAALSLAPAPHTTFSPPHGGVLTQGFKDDLATLDPAIGYDWDNWPAEKMVFDGLLDYVNGTHLAPRLAASMPTVTNGGKVYTFTLRRGIRFQNGREMTADDVAYSINRVLNPKTKSPGSSFFLPIQGADAVINGKTGTASGIKVLNRYTIRFVLTQSDVPFLNVMAMNFAYVVPKEVVAKEGANFGHKPVGTGPFIMKQWVPGQKIVFVRNPHYFVKGLPYLNGVTFLIGLDPEVALLRLEKGQLDLLGDPIPGPDFIRIRDDPNYKNQLIHTVRIETSYLSLNTRIKPLNNLFVRRAINEAIDKVRIIRILNGRGVVANQVLPPGMPGYDSGYKGYAYNPGEAKAMLAKAGYKNGFSTTIYTLNVDPQPRIAESIQHDLGQIGINASVVPLAAATMIDRAGTPGKAPMVWSGGEAWSEDFPDPSDFYGPILSCASAVSGGWNWPFFCDKKLDAIGNNLLGVTNTTARLNGYHRLFHGVMEEAPLVPINNDELYALRGANVGGADIDFVHPVHTFFYERMWKTR